MCKIVQIAMKVTSVLLHLLERWYFQKCSPNVLVMLLWLPKKCRWEVACEAILSYRSIGRTCNECEWKGWTDLHFVFVRNNQNAVDSTQRHWETWLTKCLQAISTIDYISASLTRPSRSRPQHLHISDCLCKDRVGHTHSMQYRLLVYTIRCVCVYVCEIFNRFNQHCHYLWFCDCDTRLWLTLSFVNFQNSWSHLITNCHRQQSVEHILCTCWRSSRFNFTKLRWLFLCFVI